MVRQKKKTHQRRLSRRNLFHRGIPRASTRDADNDNDEGETMKEKKKNNINSNDNNGESNYHYAQDPLRALRINGSRASRRYLIVTNTNNGVIGIACAH